MHQRYIPVCRQHSLDQTCLLIKFYIAYVMHNFDEPVDMPICKGDENCIPHCKYRRGDAPIFEPYLGTTSGLFNFVNSINTGSLCATPHCKGQLEPAHVVLRGKGGAVYVHFHCSGCSKRNYMFNSSLTSTGDEFKFGLALRVACIASGCRYATVSKIFQRYLGLPVSSENEYRDTIREMYPHMRAILNEMFNDAK